MQKVWSSFVGWWHPESLNEAHNGYIEIYLNLGWIGLFLIVLILISGYRQAVKAFRGDPELASLMLAYVTTSTFYSITEAGFRMMNLSWIFLLLAVVSSSGVTAGVFGGEALRIPTSRGRAASRAPADNKLIPGRESAYAARRGLTQAAPSKSSLYRPL